MNNTIKVFILGLVCWGLCSCKTTDYAGINQNYPTTRPSLMAETAAPMETATPEDTTRNDSIIILLILLLTILLLRQFHLSNYWGKAKKALRGIKILRKKKGLERKIKSGKKTRKR